MKENVDDLVSYIRNLEDEETPSYRPYFYLAMVATENSTDDLINMKHKYFKTKQELEKFARQLRVELIKKGYSIIQVSKYNPIHTKLSVNKDNKTVALLFESH